MMETADSIKQYGVLVPAIARPDPEGGYELVAGHRRHRASELAEKETMPVIVRDLDDDAATIIMVDSNLQRESLLPSERAFAYKMKLEAMKHQGERVDLTCSQVGNKLAGKKSSELLAEQVGQSKNQVFRFIRLTELIPELLDMLECGFCGGTLTRRSWHSGSRYNKVIWQCVTATKKGKKFCPDSKGIAEETIEQAFIESYRLLCQNNKDVLDEFIARTEETLSDSNASKQLAKVEKNIAALDAKRAKLVDMRLEEIIDKETYEQKYFDLSSQIEQLQKQRESLQESAETESTMKKRIAEFRRTLEENEVLDTFDRYVFESIVEKVIVGGYDEDGNKDPAMLTFIYKTGFKNSLDGTNFKPPRKNSKAAKQNAGLCSHTTDEAKSMCSYHSDDTCRGRLPAHQRVNCSADRSGKLLRRGE